MTIELKVEQPSVSAIEYRFDRERIILGRHPFNDLVVTAPGLASRHGQIDLKDGALHYEDLGSRMGSRLISGAGEAISLRASRRSLTPGDTLLLGEGGALRITILDFKRDEVDSAERFPLPTEPPGVLFQRLDPDLGADALSGLAHMLDAANLAEASRVLQGLVERLLPAATVSLVVPHEEAFQDRVLEGRAQRGGCEHIASPDSERVKERLACCQNIEIVQQESGFDILFPIGRGGCQELHGYLRVIAPEKPCAETELPSLSALFALLHPALVNLYHIESLERGYRVLEEENAYFRKRARRHHLYKELVAKSEAMRALYGEIDLLLTVDAPVLLQGEAGSGKKMLARAIHHLGDRSAGMFIAQSCAQLTPEELDLELFGFAEAEGFGRKGLFELADGGTLFLDEVDRLSSKLQAKLVRVMHEKEVRRIGDAVGRSVDVRVIAGTHHDLMERVDTSAFRLDLFTTFSRSVLRVPALRERLDDIEPLAEHFVRHYNRRYGLAVEDINPDARARLRDHAWPGNVRELQVVVEAAVIKARAGVIEPGHLDLA